ncbi:hypothetical protein [Streptomyces ossamyceticus]|uniref:hypothetical protein n=1 Tax=Streptomyces ossamyceticus TaxID=249581 RepID=UPI00343B3959
MPVQLTVATQQDRAAQTSAMIVALPTVPHGLPGPFGFPGRPPIGLPDTELPDIGRPTGTTPHPEGGGIQSWPGTVKQLDVFQIDPRVLASMELLERFHQKHGGVLGGGAGPGSVTPKGKGKAVHPRGSGLPVAVFLPWRQQWHFKGCSRGNLLSSIALAPDESRTIRVHSWERRAKALEQSTETDTELTQDFTSTTRDTEDVFREMTSSQDFNAEAHGQVDASYSAATVSVDVGLGGSLQQTTGLEQVCRSTTTYMQETVRRATARVASRRVTRITESQESVRGDEVLRVIRNPNRCHTLTLDYYEQLAHYVVTTKFLPDRVKVVVMVDNPLRATVFDNLTVRTNETALRQALLNAELGDAFAACRLLASYGHAWGEAERVAARSKAVAELDRERLKPPAAPDQPVKPANPHLETLLKVLEEIRTAARPVLTADIGPALAEIDEHQRPVEAVNRTAARRWLFRRLVEARIGVSFTGRLQALVDKNGPLTADDARSFADGVPSGSFPTLKDLHNLKDTEKEEAALTAPIKERMAVFWDWGWWTGSAREEGLYEPDDNGIAGACDRLVSALRAYEAKAAEGEALLTQQEMANKAGEDQTSANWVDKLEMKYGLDVVADAREREEALLAHLAAHADYYRYVLFQSLPPGEQLARLVEVAPQLKVGYFEPRVVSYSGSKLALPLTPLGQSDLARLVGNMSSVLERAAEEAAEAARGVADEDIILPTPGLTIETSVGRCSGCGPHERRLQEFEARQRAAQVALVEEEVDRRRHRREAGDLSDPAPPAGPPRLQVEVVDARPGPAADRSPAVEG